MSIFADSEIASLKDASRITCQALLLALQDADILDARSWAEYQARATVLLDQRDAEKREGK